VKLLILTDHSGHTVNNSLYAIAREMLVHEEIEEIRVASRGVPANESFFAAHWDENAAAPVQNELFTAQVKDDFSFAEGEASPFRQDQFPTSLAWPDAVWLRIPHPVPPTWFAFLAGVFGSNGAGVPVLNDPRGIALTTDKQWLLNVPELCAPMALCKTPAEVSAFAKTRNTVLKPLEGYGGKGVLRILDEEVEVEGQTLPLERWQEHPLSDAPYLAMEYLPRVSEGDKRIVVVGDEVIGAVLRIPRPGTWLANVSQGGRAEQSEISFAERRIIDTLRPKMQAIGIAMYGIDTLMGNDGVRVLSEINTMSIGGINDLAPIAGVPAAQRTAHALVAAFTRRLSAAI